MKDLLVGALLASFIIFGCNHSIEQIEKPKEIIYVEQIPLFESAYSIRGPLDHVSSKEISMTMALFYLEWVEHFGDDEGLLLKNLDNLSIMWGSEAEEVHNCYDINGVWMEKAFASGLTINTQLIWVWSRDGDVSKTSLVHELVHVAIMSINKDTSGDADHEGTKRHGWTKEHTAFIIKINDILEGI